MNLYGAIRSPILGCSDAGLEGRIPTTGHEMSRNITHLVLYSKRLFHYPHHFPATLDTVQVSSESPSGGTFAAGRDLQEVEATNPSLDFGQVLLLISNKPVLPH